HRPPARDDQSAPAPATTSVRERPRPDRGSPSRPGRGEGACSWRGCFPALSGSRRNQRRSAGALAVRRPRHPPRGRLAPRTGHRLRAEGVRLTDAALIDAYERAYAIAQAVGGDYREPDMPPMRDRLTMARRIRSYVTRGGTSTTNTSSRTDSAGRKALATMGARGGKTAAKRWNDPESEYARQQRAALAAANETRSYSTEENKGRLLALIASYRW